MFSIFNSLFPLKCIRCSKIDSALCNQCKKSLQVSRGADLPGVDQCWSAGPYSDWLREKVLLYKSGHIEYAEGLVEILHQVLFVSKVQVDWIVNVPSTTHKVRSRGFDTVGELSASLSTLTNTQHKPMLQFAHKVQDQVGLGRKERSVNLALAFTATKRISGNIALIDDVVTTGATVMSAAKTLRICGAKKIFVISLCRT